MFRCTFSRQLKGDDFDPFFFGTGKHSFGRIAKHQALTVLFELMAADDSRIVQREFEAEEGPAHKGRTPTSAESPKRKAISRVATRQGRGWRTNPGAGDRRGQILEENEDLIPLEPCRRCRYEGGRMGSQPDDPTRNHISSLAAKIIKEFK
jgi:hypothetical protein